MYEYTYEENKFGIVKIDDKEQKGPRRELPEYEAFKKAMADFPAPKGDAGYSPTQKSQPCPAVDEHWMVSSTLLPAMPEGAKKYLTEGAGKGPGLKGPGSQTAPGGSPSDAAPGSGAGGSNAANKNAGAIATADRVAFLVSGAALVSTIVGAILL